MPVLLAMPVVLAWQLLLVVSGEALPVLPAMLLVVFVWQPLVVAAVPRLAVFVVWQLAPADVAQPVPVVLDVVLLPAAA